MHNSTNNKPLSIMMLTARFYPCQGGAEIQCLRLSVKLAQLGHRALILTQKMPRTLRFELIEGLPVFRVGFAVSNMLGSFSYFLSALKTALKRFNEIDILHAHIASTPAVIAAVVTRLTGKPSLVKFAGSRATGDISTSIKTMHGRLKLNLIRDNATAFVCPSGEIASELEKYGFSKNKINIIPNGVDTVVYAPASGVQKSQLRHALGLPSEGKLVIYSGRLVKGKGLELLIECWKKMEFKNTMPAPGLLICGAGPLLESLEKSCSGTPSVRFLGWKDNALDYLKASGVFVLPSSGEGMPNSLMEAMSCGLACIGTDIGGIKELVADRASGLLFKAGDAAELTIALQTLLTDNTLALSCGEKARRTIIENYSIEKTTKAYVELYRKLIH